MPKTKLLALLLPLLMATVVLSQDDATEPSLQPILEEATLDETPEPFNRVQVRDKDKAKIPATVDLKALSAKLGGVRPPVDDWQSQIDSMAADFQFTITGWSTYIESVETKDGSTEVTARVTPRISSPFGFGFVVFGSATEVYRIDKEGKVEVVKRSKADFQGFSN